MTQAIRDRQFASQGRCCSLLHGAAQTQSGPLPQTAAHLVILSFVGLLHSTHLKTCTSYRRIAYVGMSSHRVKRESSQFPVPLLASGHQGELSGGVKNQKTRSALDDVMTSVHSTQFLAHLCIFCIFQYMSVLCTCVPTFVSRRPTRRFGNPARPS